MSPGPLLGAGSVRVPRARHLLWFSGLLVGWLGCGSTPTSLGPKGGVAAGTDLPTVDFARALELCRMAADTTKNTVVSDDMLRERYGTGGVDVQVFGTVFPGDDGESRFMLLTDAAQRRQTLVLAGTNTQLQWLIDALTVPAYQADLGANVHAGWNTICFAMYNKLLPELRTDYTLTVTGFSLGAALSCIAAEYLMQAGYNIDEVVTFGQPRLTDVAGAPVFDHLPLLRFVNEGDPFPHVLETGSSAYQFGPMVLLYDGPLYAYVPADDPRLQAEARPFESFALREFQYHSEDLYVARLEAKLVLAIQVEYLP